MWVVCYHMQDAAKVDPAFSPLRGASLLFEGFRGVDLFFLLSGFILFYVHVEDFRTLTWTRARTYAVARFWRVYPLNAVVLLMIIALACALPEFRNPASFTTAAVVQSFLIAQRWLMPDFGAINGPSWSLSVEIIGYAAFPFLVWGLTRNRSPRQHLLVAMLCLCALVAASYGLGFSDSNITGRLTILRMFPAFIAGTALAACFLSSAHEIGRRYAGALAISSTVAIVVLCAIPVCPTLTVFPLAGLVMSLAYERGVINRFMASSPVVWLGRVSFSLYLTHFTVINLLVWLKPTVGNGSMSDWAYMAGVLSMILAVAALVYYGAERPLTRLSYRFTRARAAQTILAMPSRVNPGDPAIIITPQGA